MVVVLQMAASGWVCWLEPLWGCAGISGVALFFHGASIYNAPPHPLLPRPGIAWAITAGLAQLVEQRIRNAKVVGSTPISGTINNNLIC